MILQNQFSFLGSFKTDKLAVWSLIFLIFLRILFTGFMGMMPQDAYYFFYSQNLALSYFDHPPVVAYMLRLFTSVFGQHVFSIKLADLVVTGLTALSFYHLCKLYADRENPGKPMLLLLSTFMVTVLSLVTTPDVPLMLFWSLSLLSLHKAIFQDKKMYWLLSGLLMGLAFDSKYTGIFLPAGLTLFLILSATHRKYLFTKWYWLSALVFLITVSPVVIWNVQNKFASFRFQTTERATESGSVHVDILGFLGVLGHQAAILIPILFFGLLFFIIKATRRIKRPLFSINPSTLFLLCFFLPLFLFFMSVSFIYWVKLNWMMPAYLTGIIWVSKYFSAKWIRYQLIFSLVIHLVLTFEIIFYPVPVQSDDTWYGWNQLSEKVKTIHDENPGSFVFAADGYKTSAVLNFYLDKKVYYPNVVGEQALQLDFMPSDLPALVGKEALFLDSSPRFTDENKSGTIPVKLNGYFDSVQELEPILIKRGSKSVRKYFVYRCNNYHPDAR